MDALSPFQIRKKTLRGTKGGQVGMGWGGGILLFNFLWSDVRVNESKRDHKRKSGGVGRESILKETWMFFAR